MPGTTITAVNAGEADEDWEPGPDYIVIDGDWPDSAFVDGSGTYMLQTVTIQSATTLWDDDYDQPTAISVLEMVAIETAGPFTSWYYDWTATDELKIISTLAPVGPAATPSVVAQTSLVLVTTTNVQSSIMVATSTACDILTTSEAADASSSRPRFIASAVAYSATSSTSSISSTASSTASASDSGSNIYQATKHKHLAIEVALPIAFVALLALGIALLVFLRRRRRQRLQRQQSYTGYNARPFGMDNEPKVSYKASPVAPPPFGRARGAEHTTQVPRIAEEAPGPVQEPGATVRTVHES